MVCRYIIRIRFSCFNSYVWIGQRNSIHSTSCALLFISLFPKSTYLCFASFKLSKSRNDEYIYWCHREINRYFCTSIKARISNDGVALAIAANIVTVTFLHYATVLKRLHLPFTQRLYFRRTRHRYRRRLRFYLHKYIIFSHALGIQTLWEITLTTIVYIVLLFTFKLIRKEELSRLPIIRKLSFLK